MKTKISVQTLFITLHLFIICCLLLLRPSSAQVANGTGAGNCLSYDGVNDYVAVPHSASLTPGSNPYTIEVWFYAPATNQMGNMVY